MIAQDLRINLQLRDYDYNRDLSTDYNRSGAVTSNEYLSYGAPDQFLLGVTDKTGDSLLTTNTFLNVDITANDSTVLPKSGNIAI